MLKIVFELVFKFLKNPFASLPHRLLYFWPLATTPTYMPHQSYVIHIVVVADYVIVL